MPNSRQTEFPRVRLFLDVANQARSIEVEAAKARRRSPDVDRLLDKSENGRARVVAYGLNRQAPNQSVGTPRRCSRCCPDTWLKVRNGALDVVPRQVALSRPGRPEIASKSDRSWSSSARVQPTSSRIRRGSTGLAPRLSGSADSVRCCAIPAETGPRFVDVGPSVGQSWPEIDGLRARSA